MPHNRKLIIFAVAVVCVGVVWYALLGKNAAPEPAGPSTPTGTISNVPPTLVDGWVVSPADAVIPAYYEALNAGRASDARHYLAADLAQQLTVERLGQASDALRSIQVIRTAPWAKSDGREQYETFLEVQVEPGSITSFTNGENVRVIELVLEDGAWKISKINLRPSTPPPSL